MRGKNWDKFKRMQCNIEKAVVNEIASQQMQDNYQVLKNNLVKCASDEDIFNDAYLKITYKYKLDVDFKEQFRMLFYQLKSEYKRDDYGIFYLSLDESTMAPEENTQEDNENRSPVPLDITKLITLCK